MTDTWKRITIAHPRIVVLSATLVVALLSVYGSGLFKEIKTSDQFSASGTESMQAKTIVEDKFGTAPTTDVVLFERHDNGLGDASSPAYQAEVARLLQPLVGKVNRVTTYASQPSESFISKDKTSTFAVIESNGTDAEIYKVLHDFGAQVDQSKLRVSIGGASVINAQMSETVGQDLARTEVITFPILLVLLVFFFRSVVAALIPLIISAVTIAGALAVARLLNHFVTIDHYAVNVITILGIGLAIDYALLSVNRFREELHAHGSVDRAVRLVIDTSGRTVFFSAVTVIACMLSLIVFPLDFMRSIAIGGSSAIIIAMLFTVLVLPAVLKLLGKRIDAWHLPFGKKSKQPSRFWKFVANTTTNHPILSALSAGIIIVLACIPLGRFTLAGAMDYRYLATGSSGRYVMQALHDNFASQTPGIVAVAVTPGDMSEDEAIRLSCDITNKIKAIPHVKEVVAPTTLVSGVDCETFKAMKGSGVLPATLKALYEENYKNHAMKFTVSLDVDNGTEPAGNALLAIRSSAPGNGASWYVGGMEGYAYDTNATYLAAIPKALIIIVVSMVVLLALLLTSVVIPLQAILINGISLAISFAVIVGIFQLGWVDGITHWGTTNGIVMTPLILIAAIAFGLAMDYSVFLYSRMFEVYQKGNDPKEAIHQGIIKTGPIISAAAIMVFVVVAAFALSSVTFMRMIGIGLGTAVLVDAFFVRLLLVPSVMTLMGRASWAAPKWMKRFQVRHE